MQPISDAPPPITLSMIVKDEARVIARCLASVKEHLTGWAVVDTGSTDGTQDIIRRELTGIPGKVIDLPWKGFAGSRNDALDLAREVSGGAGYFLTLDADEVLVWPKGSAMAPKLTDDVYGIRFTLIGGESTWQRTLLGRLSIPWRWVGDVHEYLDCGPHDPSKTLITGACVESHTDGARARPRRYSVFDHLPAGSQIAWSTKKYVKDVSVLEGMAKTDVADARAVFYLAQSYTGARQIDKAIETYRRRVAMGGWGEEVFYSLFQIAALREARGDDWREVARAHLEAYAARPTRAESLWALAVLHNDHGEPAVAELYGRAAASMTRPNDCLLVMESVYEWRAADEWAGALGRLGRFDEALGILRKIVAVKTVPDAERQRAIENITYIEELQRDRAGSSRAA